MKKVGIIGTGAFGLALSKIFVDNSNDVIMWTRSKETQKDLELNRTSKRLDNFVLDKNIKITTNMEDISKCDLIVLAVPAKHIDEIIFKYDKLFSKKMILIASKGIENDTYSFIEEIVRRYVSDAKIAVLSGPSFAIDIVRGEPIGFSLASCDRKLIITIKKMMASKTIKIRGTGDIIGVELCGAIKNVIAIAAGMLDGLGYCESTQAMFITKSLHDLKNLIYSLGGSKKTILTYAGFGDLLMTATSKKSRNYSFGRLFGEYKTKEEIEKYLMSTTVEGLYTLESIYGLLRKKQVDMPIIDLVKDIVEYKKDVKELITYLESSN